MGTTPWSVMTARFSSSFAMFAMAAHTPASTSLSSERSRLTISSSPPTKLRTISPASCTQKENTKRFMFVRHSVVLCVVFGGFVPGCMVSGFCVWLCGTQWFCWLSGSRYFHVWLSLSGFVALGIFYLVVWYLVLFLAMWHLVILCLVIAGGFVWLCCSRCLRFVSRHSVVKIKSNTAARLYDITKGQKINSLGASISANLWGKSAGGCFIERGRDVMETICGDPNFE